MIIKNAFIIDEHFQKIKADIEIKDGLIAAIGDRTKNIAGRNAYLMKYWAAKKVRDAERFSDA